MTKATLMQSGTKLCYTIQSENPERQGDLSPHGLCFHLALAEIRVVQRLCSIWALYAVKSEAALHATVALWSFDTGCDVHTQVCMACSVLVHSC